MSLVGTRPPTVDEYEQYELGHASFCTIAPVVTSAIAGTVGLPTKSGSPFRYASSR